MVAPGEFIKFDYLIWGQEMWIWTHGKEESPGLSAPCCCQALCFVLQV